MKSSLTQYQAALTLNALPGIGPVACRKIRDAFNDDLAAALCADAKTLYSALGIGKILGDKILGWQKLFDPEKEEEKIERLGMKFLPFFDPHYPPLLKEIPDAPIGLYVRGNIEALKTTRTVAIVGTRKASLYGTSMAQRIATELAHSRWTVVSGLARGIDTAAHAGTLTVGGTTIAVLGNGADIIYPPENAAVYKKICETGGAIVSEFPIGRTADKRTFPQRNRIIAGISAGLLVVESDEKGGSMVSANFAAECGRTVFALPGRVDQINSRGPHKLIREGATLVSGAEDIIQELDSIASQPLLPLKLEENTEIGNTHIREILSSLPPEASRIFELLTAGDALSPDVISTRLQLPASAISSNLLMLELERLVARKTDGTYEKTINE